MHVEDFSKDHISLYSVLMNDYHAGSNLLESTRGAAGILRE